MDIERLNLLASSQDIQIDIQILYVSLDDVLTTVRDIHHLALLAGHKYTLHDLLQIVCAKSLVKPIYAPSLKPVGWLLYLLHIGLDLWWYARACIAQQGR